MGSVWNTNSFDLISAYSSQFLIRRFTEHLTSVLPNAFTVYAFMLSAIFLINVMILINTRKGACPSYYISKSCSDNHFVGLLFRRFEKRLERLKHFDQYRFALWIDTDTFMSTRAIYRYRELVLREDRCSRRVRVVQIPNWCGFVYTDKNHSGQEANEGRWQCPEIHHFSRGADLSPFRHIVDSPLGSELRFR